MIFYGHRARIARGMQDARWSSRLMSLFAGKGADRSMVSSFKQADFSAKVRLRKSTREIGRQVQE